jgi:hypothetical protein
VAPPHAGFGPVQAHPSASPTSEAPHPPATDARAPYSRAPQRPDYRLKLALVIAASALIVAIIALVVALLR